ncbi:MAG: MAPEG family protein [Pseudomonadota bacterium]
MHPLLPPTFVLLGLTFAVWILLYLRRVREMKAKRIHPQKVASRADAQRLLEDTSASNNFQNLLEMPLLYYALVALVIATDTAPGIIRLLAWAFVALRIVHSVIHVTYNTVLHRFWVYFVSSVMLWSAWGVFVWRQLGL